MFHGIDMIPQNIPIYSIFILNVGNIWECFVKSCMDLNNVMHHVPFLCHFKHDTMVAFKIYVCTSPPIIKPTWCGPFGVINVPIF